MVSVIDTKPSPSLYHALTWSLGLITEIFLFGATLAVYTQEHREPKAGSPDGGKLEHHATTWEAIEIVVDFTRLLCLIALVSLYGLFVCLQRWKLKCRHAGSDTPEETTRLLNGHEASDGPSNGAENGSANGIPEGQVYGTNDGHHKDVEEPAGWVRPEKVPPRNWWEYVSAYSLFIPYLWPAKKPRLQIFVIVCFVIMAIARVVNLMVPIAAGRITDILAGENGPS